MMLPLGTTTKPGHERPAGRAVAGEVGQLGWRVAADLAVRQLVDVLALGVLVAEELAVELVAEDVVIAVGPMFGR